MTSLDLDEFVKQDDTVITEESLYLAHHGILGQKWGQENGPPYPLGAGDHSKAQVAAAKATGTTVGKSSGKGSIENLSWKEKRAAKKIQKQRETNLKKAREAKVTKAQQRSAAEKHEEERKAALKSGNAELIKKYAAESSTQELQEAVNRMNLYSQIDQKIPKEKQISVSDKIDKAMNAVDKTRSWVEKGTNAYNTFAKIYNSLNGEDDDLKLLGQDNSNRKTAADKKRDRDEKARSKWAEKVIQDQDIDAFKKNSTKFTNAEVSQYAKRLKDINKILDGEGIDNGNDKNN